MKKLVVVTLLILGGLFVLKKTKVGSYITTIWENGRASIARHVPRHLELDRVRNEIGKIDTDVQTLLGPIATKKAAIKRLEREIKTAEDNLKEQTSALRELTRQVEAGNTQVSYKGEDYTLEEAKVRLAQDFSFCKRCDARLKTQKKVLAAHSENLRLATKHLDRLVEQKKEFELRLLERETVEADLKLQRLATPTACDSNRSADILRTLEAIEAAQEVEQIENQLRQQYSPRANNRPRTSAPALNLPEIKNFLGTSNVVQNN
ncbi:MAG: hypothetical protein L0Z62_44045 [Gemmataceae bacterium]|nr:hypothetical protein [Gemmataceae bacterium]